MPPDWTLEEFLEVARIAVELYLDPNPETPTIENNRMRAAAGLLPQALAQIERLRLQLKGAENA